MSSNPYMSWKTREGRTIPMNLSSITKLLSDDNFMERWRVARLRATELDEGIKRIKLVLANRKDPDLKMVFAFRGTERVRLQSARLFRGNTLLSFKEVI